MPGFYLPSEEDYDPKVDAFVCKYLAKERKYQHFDLPPPNPNEPQSLDFSNEAEVHRFLPLLGYTDEVRKFVRDHHGNRSIKIKERPIRFASHRDAGYLQAYSEFLSPIYDAALRSDGIDGMVLAYRRGGGTNIHHANSLFSEIASRRDCTVVALDISGFFDSIDHLHLKAEICRLLSVERLDGHHWTVFNNVTRYSWVESDDLDYILGKRRRRFGRVCTPQEFNDNVRGRKLGLIRKHQEIFGIPQGTPVSGLFANIFLRTFDVEMAKYVEQYGGSYRRYSDDIALVLPIGAKVSHVVSLVEKVISDFGLSLSTGKTEYAEFRDGVLVSPKPIQYLGFTYDGRRKLIRASSLDAYLYKMRTGIHAKLVAAKQKDIPSFKVFKRELISRYTHKGKRRNFIHYAYKSSSILNAPEIRTQVKDHIHWFNKAWDREVTKVYGGLVEAS